MNYTTNYQLNQWEAGDRVTRADFNADNAKIDAAIAGAARIACGTYRGIGTFGTGNPVRLSFDFEPKLVIVSGAGGTNLQYLNVLFHSPSTSCRIPDEYLTVTWTENGLRWYSVQNASAQMNYNGSTYHYAAFG